MIIGIDASNIISGGGQTHLIEILKVSDPKEHNFSKIILWSNKKTLSLIDNKHWIEKQNPIQLEKGVFQRFWWQRTQLSQLAKNKECDILFVPGGLFLGKFKPFVTMSRNMLPFEYNELFRFGISFLTIKLLILRFAQKSSFVKAQGIIFLTKYAKKIVTNASQLNQNKTVVIPHGVNRRFSKEPRKQISLKNKKIKILYVSLLEKHKHQDIVAKAVNELSKLNYNIKISFVGPSKEKSKISFLKLLKKLDKYNNHLNYMGEVKFSSLHKLYQESDLFLYASSCENLPNILLEAMASGLPIVCSNKGPMPEILQNGGIYFNPLNKTEIMNALKKTINSKELREKISKNSYSRSRLFTWEKCAKNTFLFLNKIYLENIKKRS
tara:strand:+ start:2799 stop:3941 length:1143 start_codon:yes stop_codon:yes gene_type:complete